MAGRARPRAGGVDPPVGRDDARGVGGTTDAAGVNDDPSEAGLSATYRSGLTRLERGGNAHRGVRGRLSRRQAPTMGSPGRSVDEEAMVFAHTLSKEASLGQPGLVAPTPSRLVVQRPNGSHFRS